MQRGTVLLALFLAFASCLCHVGAAQPGTTRENNTASARALLQGHTPQHLGTSPQSNEGQLHVPEHTRVGAGYNKLDTNHTSLRHFSSSHQNTASTMDKGSEGPVAAAPSLMSTPNGKAPQDNSTELCG
ncbi:uncharacterized protein Tco025E_05106 [Trypanosoma conorhini]|uniref:Mucin TcMUCII n=1 Tax=Trypanosoma conorhini TaxID=83891 RepID=A0A3S5IT39_9TRYP|nr:uncharacterized protein Tco025E_05106 [Trypanosoma conorhini]RNF16627.1 hypothetical protein Tco025E_05106 [Trypanosoma conorhini]